MVSYKATAMIDAYSNAKEYYYRVMEEEPNLFENSERKETARKEFHQAYKTLCNYIADLEEKANTK